jgi:TolB-like protein/DNA-binding winged helix-turn-helix (wHTH) protein/Tfp pilus assembly protein PilF
LLKFVSKSFQGSMEAPAHQRYSFGPFVLDPAEKVLLRDAHPVPLPPKALETLLALVEKRGHVIDKAELLQRVWPDTFVEEATLAQNIFTLRKVLGNPPDGQEYIETVPKRGYRFVAAVKAVAEKKESAGARAATFRAGLHRRLLWIAAPILVAMVSLGVYLRGRPHRPVLSAGPGKVILAVLPFENLSANPQQEYFSDGLTEEMIAQLSRINPERLRVIARTSAMQYKAAAKTAAQIGHELGVNYILESSIRREGDRVRITTQLVRVSDQTHLWSQSYERDMRGVLILQKEVASDVATQIALKLDPRAAEHATGISNLDAYEAYLKGRFFWNKRSEQGYLKAIEYFERAIAEDSGYAQAYSGLADTYALLGSNPTTAITRKDAMAKARAAALKAVALDDTLAEAHTSLAFVYWHYDWNWPAAEKEFQRALQLNPSYPTAHHWYAFYLVSQGRIDQGLEEIRRAREMDPLSLIINADVAQILYFAHQYDQAIEQANRVLEMDPNFALARVHLAWSYLAKQQYEPALEQIKEGMRTPGAKFYLEANLGATYAMMGQKTAARDILQQLKAKSEKLHTEELLTGISQVLAALGEKDQAFAWLEKDVQNRDGGLTLIKVEPYLDSLHGDPRFADLVRRIGLPP